MEVVAIQAMTKATVSFTISGRKTWQFLKASLIVSTLSLYLTLFWLQQATKTLFEH